MPKDHNIETNHDFSSSLYSSTTTSLLSGPTTASNTIQTTIEVPSLNPETIPSNSKTTTTDLSAAAIILPKSGSKSVVRGVRASIIPKPQHANKPMRFIHVSANMCVRKHKKSSSKKTSPVTNLAMTAPSILKAYANHYTSTNSQLSEEQQNEQEHSLQLRNSMYDTSQHNHEHTLLNHDTMYHNNNSNNNNHSNSTITSSHPNHELHHVLDVTNPHNTHAMSNKMVRAGSSSSINACNDRVGACNGDDHGTLQQPLTTNRRGSIASSTSTASNACMECTSTNQLVPSSPHASSNNMMIKNGRVCSPSTLLHSSNNNHACTSQIRFVMEDNFANTAPPKKRNILTKHQIIRVLHLSQAQACKILGCSISTLKRRFGELKHELGMEKWPSYFDDVRHLPVFPQLYPMSLSYILNEENVSP